MLPNLGHNKVMTEVTAVLAPSKARQLMAFARSAEPRSALSARSLAGDVLFAALVAAASLAAVSLSSTAARRPPWSPPCPWRPAGGFRWRRS